MRYPKIKNERFSIDVIAPSCGVGDDISTKLRMDCAINHFKKLGHDVKLSKNLYSTNMLASASADERAEEFVNSMKNDNSELVVAIRGGELQLETLPFIPFDELKNLKDIKWFQGFSDNTAYTFTLTTMCDIATIYGPMFGEFGMKKWHPYLIQNYGLWNNKLSVLKSSKKYEIKSLKKLAGHELDGYNCTEKTKYSILNGEKEVSLTGRLIGGCLDILVVLCGSKYDKVEEFNEKYKDDGFLWYLEACDLNEFDTIRALWKLSDAGWFKYCKGFLIGRPKCTEFSIATKEEVYLRHLSKFNVPIIMDMDFGHVSPRMPIINGAIANVIVKNGKGEIKYILK